MSLVNINKRIEKMKKNYNLNNSKNVIIFISESEDLKTAIIKIQYDGINKIFNCNTLDEYYEIMQPFENYKQQIFFNVERPRN